MRQQLFTTTGEAKGDEKERTEQSFPARREKRSNGKADRDKNER
jgi:hypothetical protein